MRFENTGWIPLLPPTQLNNVDSLGINTTADNTNRLAVSSSDTLLTHNGSGHRVKVNKAAVGDTASLLFQSDWSGRAEMGLAASDNWSLKVSPDGSNWISALEIGASTGLASGQAVQVSPTDTTAGRLMRADYGYGPGNLLGAVSKSGGVPTGAILEQGENSNGRYVRWADGTQICTKSIDARPYDVNISVASQFYRTGVQTWSYPASFIVAPAVLAQGVRSNESVIAGVSLRNGPTTTSTSWFLWLTSQTTGTGAFRQAHFLALGRWI